jgi:hypothetical protein
LTCQFTSEEYAYYVLGTLDQPEYQRIHTHLSEGCGNCGIEIKDALEFWYFFAVLTERTQSWCVGEPSPALRTRVLGVAQQPKIRQMYLRPKIRAWMQVAAGVLLVIGGAGLSWHEGQSQIKSHVAAAEAQAERQAASVKQLEAENSALRSLVLAARNAPAAFPGRDSIVSVQDPNMVRDLQRARQTQIAMAQALNEERGRAAELGKRLSQTTSLLAAATRDQEDADRRARKAFDSASLERERKSLSTEIGAVNTRIQDLEAEIAKDRSVIDSQSKGIEQYTRMISFLHARNLAMVQLRSSGGETVGGVALIADDTKLAFFPTNLPAAPAGRTYQLWLIRDKVPLVINGGTFDRIAKDKPSLEISSNLMVAGTKAVAVTEEPMGGSPQPTGRKLIEGSTAKR